MDTIALGIKDKYQKILEEIQNEAVRAGRKPEDVRLIVVTKAQPVEVVQAVIQAGARYLGENYPEETQTKLVQMKPAPDVEWHMIGHLQSRKARIVVQHFTMLHSLDSLSLAEKLNRQLAEASRTLPVLMQFNVSGEESKYGWDASSEDTWEEFLPVVETIRALPALQLKGLMTMPPLFDRPEDVRPYFQRLRRLRDYFNQQIPGLGLTELSMGTSGDYHIAVQEGSTFVRIGTAIVGPRPPKNR
ncbi:MAG TPA: YggS family pyridoxal phosphate-dependent enzyme [Chloroflexi bacterium]|mgnify:CR=1 FL=1|nr:YggS family pyridoxal phosphate-dependent enzyme [Chloroflexota bacterium]